MENTLYLVANNLELGIREIKYIKKTDSFYWTNEKSRYALENNYSKFFDKKEDAVNHLKYLLERQISHLKSSLDYYNEKLESFKSMYNIEEVK